MNAEREAKLRMAAAVLREARRQEAEAWENAKALMQELHALGREDGGGPTYVDLAEIFGFTKARSAQLVTGIRASGETKDIRKYKPTTRKRAGQTTRKVTPRAKKPLTRGRRVA